MTIISPQKYKLDCKNAKLSYDYISRIGLNLSSPKRSAMWLYRNNFANCGMQNVAVSALYYFSLMKAKKVFIFGLDMNEFMHFTIDQNNDVWAVYKHFYGEDKSNQTELGFIKKGEFCVWLGYYSKMFYEFSYVSKFADVQGTKIYNMNCQSYVDVFEKITMEDINCV